MKVRMNPDHLIIIALDILKPSFTISGLSEALDIDRKTVRSAIKRLQNLQLCPIEVFDRGVGLEKIVTLHPELRGICQQIFPMSSPCNTHVIPHPINPTPTTFCGEFNPKTVNQNFSPCYILYNNVYFKHTLSDFLSTSKTTSPSTIDPEGVVRAVKKEFSSSIIRDQPSERPPEVDISFKNNLYREAARRTGLHNIPYKVWPSKDVSPLRWEELLAEADANFFAYYSGLDRVARDIAFAQTWMEVYQTVTEQRKVRGPNKYALELVESPSGTSMNRKTSSWQNWRRARIWADSKNAKYGDWCKAILQHYQKHPPKYLKHIDGVDSTKNLDRYSPKLLSGPAAREIYNEFWDESTRIVRIKRDEIEKLDPDFLPENYMGTEKQNAYFREILIEVKALAEANTVSLKGELDKYIELKILSQKVAENPELNTYCPGYKYGGPAKTWVDGLLPT
jgi:hypothetical protein